MDAITPKGQQGRISADEHSHLVKPAEMEWKPSRFPGCEIKPLLSDPKTGLSTALFRFAPGAVLPDHEHVSIEQTYVLEGHLVDRTARPAASRSRRASSSGASPAAGIRRGRRRAA